MNKKAMLLPMIPVLLLLDTPVHAGDVLYQSGRVPIEYIYPGNNLYINGVCELKLRPNRAVVAGGVESSSLNIADAGKRLDSKINEIKTLAGKHKGTYVPLERLRSIEERKCGTPREGQAGEFNVLQRLELEFPLSARIDSVLEQLVRTGMNRFGRNIKLYPGHRKRQVLVYYRFSDSTIEPAAIKNTCISQALDNWCAETGLPQGHRWCEQKDRARYFQVQNINLKSQPVMQENGSSRAVQLYFSNGTLTVPEIELLGDMELHLKGNVQLRVWQK